MRVRVARHTERLEEVAAFYRDRVGLPELGRFRDHEGYDGVFLGIPSTGAELELTAGGDHPPTEPHPELLLVLYYDTEAKLLAVAERIAGPQAVAANPYWQRNAKCFVDPDGFQVLLALSRTRDAGPATAPVPVPFPFARGLDLEESQMGAAAGLPPSAYFADAPRSDDVLDHRP